MVCAAIDPIRGAGLDAIVGALREAIGVQRCTLRLEVEGDLLPVVHESIVAPARSLIGDRSVALPGQPVIEAILGGAEQVVQPDTRAASSDPAFLAMLEHYGGMGAQIVTAVRDGERLVGVISLHHLGGAREWSAAETGLALATAALVARMLSEPPPARA